MKQGKSLVMITRRRGLRRCSRIGINESNLEINFGSSFGFPWFQWNGQNLGLLDRSLGTPKRPIWGSKVEREKNGRPEKSIINEIWYLVEKDLVLQVGAAANKTNRKKSIWPLAFSRDLANRVVRPLIPIQRLRANHSGRSHILARFHFEKNFSQLFFKFMGYLFKAALGLWLTNKLGKMEKKLDSSKLIQCWTQVLVILSKKANENSFGFWWACIFLTFSLRNNVTKMPRRLQKESLSS